MSTLPLDKALKESDYERAAKELGVSVAAIKAVAEVESTGDGFLSTGEPKILFERHIMFKLLAKKYSTSVANNFSNKYPDLVNKVAGGYGKYSEQHRKLDRAVKLIDRECALQSCSWGKFQVMGMNWEMLGYASIQAMVNAAYRSEGEHLDMFVRFIKATPAALSGLRELDWPKFARAYNGPGYDKNNYDVKMKNAYNKYK